MKVEQIIQLSSALLTPLLAIVATYIAVQQWKLERQKWRLELYEQRFETYRAIVEFLSLISQEGNCDIPEAIIFLKRASRNKFLFDAGVQKYIESLYKRAIDLRTISKELKCSGSQDEQKFLAEKELEQFRWFTSQFDIVDQKFGDYLRITKK